MHGNNDTVFTQKLVWYWLCLPLHFSSSDEVNFQFHCCDLFCVSTRSNACDDHVFEVSISLVFFRVNTFERVYLNNFTRSYCVPLAFKR